MPESTTGVDQILGIAFHWAVIFAIVASLMKLPQPAAQLLNDLAELIFYYGTASTEAGQATDTYSLAGEGSPRGEKSHRGDK